MAKIEYVTGNPFPVEKVLVVVDNLKSYLIKA